MPGESIDLVFPVRGLDESNAFGRQPDGTCADALNVRAFEPTLDRMRGASRPGLSRYCPSLISGQDLSIQSLDVIVSAYPGGHVAGQQFSYSQTAGADSWGLGVGGTGGVIATGGEDAEVYQCSCWDASGNCYTAVWFDVTETTGVKVYKTNAAGTIAWNVSILNATACGGIATDGTSVYVGVTKSSPSSLVYKLLAADGTGNGSAWIDTGGVLLADFSNDHSTASGQRQNQLACCGGVLGCNLIAGGVGYVFQCVTTATGVSAGSHTIADVSADSASAMDTAADGSGFFYAVVGGQSVVGVVAKVTLAAVFVWTQAVISGAGDPLISITYDPVSLTLAASGGQNRITGATGNVALLNTGDGGTLAQANIGSGVNWDTIRAAGDGGFLLWRVNSTLNVAKLSPTLGVLWGPITRGGAAHVGGSVNVAGAVSAFNLGNRFTQLIATSNGNIRRFDRLDRYTVTNGDGALTGSEPVVFAVQAGPYLFFVDSWQYKYLDAATGTVLTWAASPGTLPQTSDGRKCRLIENYRGGVMLSGLDGDPANWFLSKRGNPFDYDYAPASPNSTQAVAGNNSPAGLIGEKITALCRWTDDVLIFGEDHGIYMMSGDPAAGGSVDCVSDNVGMAWGRPFTKTPDNAVVFFGRRGGVYIMEAPGQRPQLLNQAISDRLKRFDLSSTIFRMAWDDGMQGAHLFVTPLDRTVGTLHYFWEMRSNAWWPDEFAKKYMNPKCVLEYDGDDPDDRVVLIGSWDGYVRELDHAATTDDGFAFDRTVLIGPLLGRNLAEIMVTELQATLAADSGIVAFGVVTGRSAEEAVHAEPVVSGSWVGGSRQYTSAVQKSGYAFYVRLLATTPFSIEALRAKVHTLGMVRGRGRR